jgi:hypothetical protein
MSDMERRIEHLESVIQSKHDRLTMPDGSVSVVPRHSWLKLAAAVISEQAALYEGNDPEPLSPDVNELRDLYARAIEDPSWAIGERSMAVWARDSGPPESVNR